MEYIERNALKCFNMPSLIGRRLTVYDVVTQIYLQHSLDKAVNGYEISRTQAMACLKYCSDLLCKTNSEAHQFCDGCVLRTIADGEVFDRDDYNEIRHEDGTKSTCSKADGLCYLGSLDDFEREERGRETWTIAQKLLDQYRQSDD